MATPENMFFYICPPTVSSVDPAHQVLSVATSGAAANYDWNNALGLTTNAPKGSVMLLLEASGFDCFVRFKAGLPATAASAGTTILNGLIVKAGQPGRCFHVNPELHGVVDFIAAGAGTLQVQVSSPIGMRNKQ